MDGCVKGFFFWLFVMKGGLGSQKYNKASIV